MLWDELWDEKFKEIEEIGLFEFIDVATCGVPTIDEIIMDVSEENDESDEEVIEELSNPLPLISRAEADDAFVKVQRYVYSNSGTFHLSMNLIYFCRSS